MPECLECLHLRRKHADTTVRHAEFWNQLRAAVQDGTGEVVTALTAAYVAALRERDMAEIAFRRHQYLSHGGGRAEEKSA